MSAGATFSSERRSLLAVTAALGLSVAAISVALPAVRFLRAPDVVTILAGLIVMSCGAWLIRTRAPGFAPGLVFASGCAWFLPDLAATGIGSIDEFATRLSLLHVALLVHALMLRPVRVPAARRIAVGLGYACVPATFLGGYHVLLVATGTALLIAGVSTPTGRATGWAASAARVSLGAGIAIPQGLSLLTGATASAWGTGVHAATWALSAGLLIVALAPDPSPVDPVTDLDAALSAELGTQVRLVVPDGDGGWIDPYGLVVLPPPDGSTPVRDAGGRELGRLLGRSVRPRGPVVRTIALAATNARLRRAVLRQVEELADSRQRVVQAAEQERRTILGELADGILGPLAGLERSLRSVPTLTRAADHVVQTRARLERFAETVDPFHPGETLQAALRRLAGPASRAVEVRACVEPVDPSVRRAVWFCCAEALANARKHAPGATVTVTVSPSRGGIRLRVADDGPGGAVPSGSGLSGLRDRVRSLRGTVNIESGDKGTILVVWLPDLDLARPSWLA